jgi:hypothetical protein
MNEYFARMEYQFYIKRKTQGKPLQPAVTEDAIALLTYLANAVLSTQDLSPRLLQWPALLASCDPGLDWNCFLARLPAGYELHALRLRHSLPALNLRHHSPQ